MLGTSSKFSKIQYTNYLIIREVSKRRRANHCPFEEKKSNRLGTDEIVQKNYNIENLRLIYLFS